MVPGRHVEHGHHGALAAATPALQLTENKPPAASPAAGQGTTPLLQGVRGATVRDSLVVVGGRLGSW